MFCQTIEIEWHRCKKYIHQFSDNGLYLNRFNKTQSNYIFKHMTNWLIFSEVSTFHSHNILLLVFSIMKMWQRQMWPRPFLRNAPCCSLTGWWGPRRLTSVQIWIHPCCPDLSENTSGCLGLCKGLKITLFSIGPIIIHYGKTEQWANQVANEMRTKNTVFFSHSLILMLGVFCSFLFICVFF